MALDRYEEKEGEAGILGNWIGTDRWRGGTKRWGTGGRGRRGYAREAMTWLRWAGEDTWHYVAGVLPAERQSGEVAVACGGTRNLTLVRERREGRPAALGKHCLTCLFASTKYERDLRTEGRLEELSAYRSTVFAEERAIERAEREAAQATTRQSRQKREGDLRAVAEQRERTARRQAEVAGQNADERTVAAAIAAGRVCAGGVVHLRDLDAEEEATYFLDAVEELADGEQRRVNPHLTPPAGIERVTTAAPLGRALLGREVGEEVALLLAGETSRFVILGVDAPPLSNDYSDEATA
jgi:transcription elongation GreA/GreB family factor